MNSDKKIKELEFKKIPLKDLHKVVGGNGMCTTCGFNGELSQAL